MRTEKVTFRDSDTFLVPACLDDKDCFSKIQHPFQNGVKFISEVFYTPDVPFKRCALHEFLIVIEKGSDIKTNSSF